MKQIIYEIRIATGTPYELRYIGSTRDYVKRKAKHASGVLSGSRAQVYQYIRYYSNKTYTVISEHENMTKKQLFELEDVYIKAAMKNHICLNQKFSIGKPNEFDLLLKKYNSDKLALFRYRYVNEIYFNFVNRNMLKLEKSKCCYCSKELCKKNMKRHQKNSCKFTQTL